MKIKCAALTIAVALAVGFHATPLTAQVPPAGRVYRLGMLSGGKAPQGPVSLGAEWPDTSAALRALGYEEGRQLRHRSPICGREGRSASGPRG